MASGACLERDVSAQRSVPIVFDAPKARPHLADPNDRHMPPKWQILSCGAAEHGVPKNAALG